MLTFNRAALRRGTRVLFKDASFTIHQGRSVGLIGANGAGKSSLFELILGEIDTDEGSIELSAGTRIAHMAQEVAATQQPALEYVLQGDEELTKIQKQLEQADANEDYTAVARLHEKLDTLDGYTAEARALQLMAGLGFSTAESQQPLASFSGGWRIRLNLARTLMSPSDLLLLDEPTNHLDLDTIIWLSNWIKQYQGSMLLISHDREFLDETVDSILHIENQGCELYSGNFTQFESLRAARLAEQQASFARQQREIAHMQSFVDRFRAKATKARQAQSRLKALARMELIAPAHVDSPFEFTIPGAEKISDPLLSIDLADMGYSHDVVLKNVRLSLHPGDRVGLLGHNGAGKTTLVKSLRGELCLIAGERVEGINLRVGYFSQHQVDDLDLSLSCFQHIQKEVPDWREQEVRNFLGGYDFHGDMVMEPITHFSGGEKARLALAKVALTKPNLLLMDEPTNHLDMDMRQALTVALQDFDGAIVLISHDRHLLASTVDSFLLVDEGQVTEFDGDLDDYRERLLGVTRSRTPSSKGASVAATEGKVDSKQSHENHKQARQLRTRIKSLDQRLERLQRKLAEVDEKLGNPDLYQQRDDGDLQTFLREQLSLKEEIQTTEDEWLELNGQLESLES